MPLKYKWGGENLISAPFAQFSEDQVFDPPPEFPELRPLELESPVPPTLPLEEDPPL